MVGGSLTSSARTGAADISESEVKTAVESASIRRIMFPPRGFALRNLFLLAGTRHRSVATTRWCPESEVRQSSRSPRSELRIQKGHQHSYISGAASAQKLS